MSPAVERASRSRSRERLGGNQGVRAGVIAMQEELRKHYKGVLEDWKIDLALVRIRLMGFPKSDWPDLMQELAIAMLDFRYDPARANGATEQTAVYEVVNRTLLHQMRTRYRDAAKLKRYAREMGVKADGTGEEPSCHLSAPVDMDVRQVCASLPDFDRKVCRAMIAGSTTAEIARELDCKWTTVDKAIGRIRQAFIDAGLHEGIVR
jgi:DNA-directed RNA polymerase specialized sigma24 family protein